MPIDLEQALGATLPPVTSSWDEDDVILFHLGIGAGFTAPTEPSELEYTYEPHLKVLPTFAIIPSAHALPTIGINAFPGVDIDLRALLHGEQETILHAPIPTRGRVTSTARIADIWDKGSAAVIVLDIDSQDESGAILYTNRASLFVRGEGGFGGEKGPSRRANPPERPPDVVIESPTLPHQALLYRLSGDKNPLHADPDVAKAAGFDNPILHGVCTYSIVCKAVIDRVLGGDISRVARYRARFAGIVLPGETIVTNTWLDTDQILITAHTGERQNPVLSNATITLGPND